MERRNRGWRRVALEAPDADAPPTPTRAVDPELREPPTRVDAGCEIDGHLRLSGPLVVEGEFRGRVTCSDDVIVGESGTVEAPITARRLVIRGAVVGDVEATREVVIHAGARLHGAVVTPCLVIERGGFFQGSTEMYRPEQIARRAADTDADGADRVSAPDPRS